MTAQSEIPIILSEKPVFLYSHWESMTLDYNIFLEVAVIPLDIILCTFLIIRYTNPTPVNIAFRRFAFCVLIADVVDVATAVVTSMREAVPNPVHYLFNTTDSILAALSGFFFIYYVYACIDMDHIALRWRDTANKLLLALDILLLLSNPFTAGSLPTMAPADIYIRSYSSL